MNKKKGPGLKSAFDLAMERLEKKDGKPTALSEGQKKAIAEIDRQAKAKTAEVEIMMQKQMMEAREKNDGEALQKLEEQKTAEIGRIRRRAEDDREKVRSQK